MNLPHMSDLKLRCSVLREVRREKERCHSSSDVSLNGKRGTLIGAHWH